MASSAGTGNRHHEEWRCRKAETLSRPQIASTGLGAAVSRRESNRLDIIPLNNMDNSQDLKWHVLTLPNSEQPGIVRWTRTRPIHTVWSSSFKTAGCSSMALTYAYVKGHRTTTCCFKTARSHGVYRPGPSSAYNPGCSEFGSVSTCHFRSWELSMLFRGMISNLLLSLRETAAPRPVDAICGRDRRLCFPAAPFFMMSISGSCRRGHSSWLQYNGLPLRREYGQTSICLTPTCSPERD